MTEAGPWEYATHIVRIFPDYAGTVVWFGGLFPYPETCLSHPLIERLETWEGIYYAALTADFTWRSIRELERFDAKGTELARELAGEVGPEFEIEYRSFANREVVTRLSSDGPASNDAARKAFSARAGIGRAEWARAQARLAAAPTDSTSS